MENQTAIEDFAAAYGQPLEWVQPAAMRREYELRAGQRLFGTLRFASAFGSLANAVTSAGAWTFKRVGFFSTRVTARRAGEAQDLAVFYPRWTGTTGKLETASGREYIWKVANFWSTRFVLADLQDQPLITYASGREDGGVSDIFKVQARVTIEPAARHLPDLPLLVALGWYLILLHHEDSTAVAAAAGAGS